MGDIPHGLEQLCAGSSGLELVTAETERAQLSHDTWVRGYLERRCAEARPAAAVVRPRSTVAVSALLKWADESSTPLVPFGLGSGVCGAVRAEPGQVVVDMGRMTSILALNDHSLIVTVQPGIRGADLEAELGRRGLTLGHFPQSIDVSTIGGWVSTRASGQLSTLYGNIEDMVLGLEAVIPGGRVIRLPSVPRSATGPDLRQLLLGSEGTLGVVTEVTLRLHPRAESERGRCYAFDTLAKGIEALRLILRAGWRPAVTRLYDSKEAGRNFAGAEAGDSAVLLLMSHGPASLVEAETKAAAATISGLGGRDLGEEPLTSWLEHRNEVPDFDTLLDQGLVFDTIEVAAAWDCLVPLYDTVVERVEAMEKVIAMTGHLSHCYTQGANIYFTFVAAEQDPAVAMKLYDRVWETTMTATRELGGTVSHHHGIGRVRKPWLAEELGDARELLVALKTALDPKGIMNPGVLVDLN